MTAPALPPDVRALYPFTPKSVTVGGHRMSYVDEGTGPAILCVHGNPTWSFYFREVVSQLSGAHRVVAVDHIGCGLSEKPGAADYPFTLARRVADLDDFIRQVIPEGPITLMAHDWGGMIACAWACRHLDRVRAVIVGNTAAFPRPDGKPLPWQLRLVRSSPALAALLVQGLNLFAAGAARACVMRPLPLAARRGLLFPYRSWADRLAVLRFVQDIPATPDHTSYETVVETAALLPELARKSMLVLWGMHDFVFDADYLAEWRRRTPEARVIEFPRAGHYLLEDEPEGALAAVRGFLAELPATA